MAGSGNANARRKRRLPRHPASTALPRERLPIGILPSARRTSVTAHITTISQPSEERVSSKESNVPTYTNPSFLTEIDPGLDLHQRESHINLSHPATFADMARAGLGPDRDRTGLGPMASQEPVSIAHYLKFKKPRHRKGGPSPLHEGDGASYPIDLLSQRDEHDSVEPLLGEQNMSRPFASTGSKSYQNQEAKVFIPVNPFDAQQQHSHLARQTFGELPSLQYLHSNEGKRDGEIQFTIDEGGDISAHAWSANSFQWVTVGLYSYRRKAIEGALGVRQLKGQKIGSVMPRNQLELFLALAKQYEEENSITTVSPSAVSGYDPSTARARGQRQPVPMLSPRPQRPALVFGTTDYLNGSMSSAGLASQRPNLPTLGRLGTSFSPVSTRDHRSPFVGISSQPALRRASVNSSSTTDSDVSPTTRRPQPIAQFKKKEPILPTSSLQGYNHGMIGGRPSASDATQGQMQAWYEEQTRLQQSFNPSKYLVSGDSDLHMGMAPYDGRVGPPATQRGYPDQPSSSPFIFGGNHDQEVNQEQMTISSVPYTTRYGLSAFVRASDSVAFDKQYEAPIGQGRNGGLPWEDAPGNFKQNFAHQVFSIGTAGSSQPAHSGRPRLESTLAYPGLAKACVADRSDGKQKSVSIASIGPSDVDHAWENRQIRVYGVPPPHVFGGQAPAEKLTLPDPPLLNGPFFTAADESRNHPIVSAEFINRAGELWDSLKVTHAAREEHMIHQAQALHQADEKKFDRAAMNKLVTDPLNTLIWGVKNNLEEYKQYEPGRGDYFQRQFKMPRSELIDSTPNGNRSFFKPSSPSPEEVVVFKGRTFGSSSQSQDARSQVNTPPLNAPKGPSGRSGSRAMRSMGFDEQAKRLAGRDSSLRRR